MIYLPHPVNDQLSTFIDLPFDDAEEGSLLLTPDHLILAGECEGSAELVLRASQSVKVGDCLMNKRGEKVRVLNASETRSRGVYTVVTGEAYVVVGGVVASPFAVNHFIVNKFYDLHRLVHRLAPALAKSFMLSSLNQLAAAIADFATA